MNDFQPPLSILVSGIRRDMERTPGARGGIVEHSPGTQGIGGSGCPGDNVVADWDELEAYARKLHAENAVLRARIEGWARDAQFPEYVPEEVTDAAFRSQADWWRPETSDGFQRVIVPQLIEQVAESTFRASVAWINSQKGDSEA